MKLKRIDYSEHEIEGSIPETITVELTAREAVYIARLLGQHSHLMADVVMDGGHVENYAIHSVLSGVANAHFECGVDDWVRVVAK